jgi:S1-C subfamily serine protease
MPIGIVCPGCRAAYQVPENLVGKSVKCWQCEQTIAVPSAASDPATAEPAATRQKPTPQSPDDLPCVLPVDPEPLVEVTAVDAAERPRPARRRVIADDDSPPRRAPKRRRPKGHLSPGKILAVIFAVLLFVGGALGAGWLFLETYYPSKAPNQTQTPDGLMPLPFRESPVMERQEQFEVYFRKPEELPVHEMEFTEPPVGSEPSGPGGNVPNVRNTTGQLTPDVLKKVKESTVYLRVKSNLGESEGSGFFVVEPGFVLTNAHVVGMLARNAPLPTSVRVVRDKGETHETTLTAKVVAVDHDADLALLSVPKEGLPAPLVVKSAQNLQETQPVYVAGFPLGELPGKSITINKYELSSLKKEKGVLDKLQIQGGMQPGNSGGPVLDADGAVIGVCVAILRNTNINFAIPGDKVHQFLNGRLAALTLEPPARVEDKLQVPVAVKVVDPLGRVRRASVAFWVGKPGPSRPGSWTPPAPRPGDGPRQTLALDIRQQAGRGEVTLPPLPEGQVYWIQPSLVHGGGARMWLSAEVYEPPPPLERKPVSLVLKPDGSSPLVLERWSLLHFPDPTGRDHRALVTLETRLTDTASNRQGNEVVLSRQFTGFKEGLVVDGEEHMTRRIQHIGPNIHFLAVNVNVDAQGKTQKDDLDAKVNDVNAVARAELITFGQDVHKCLQALEVPLPGETVQPGKTWIARRPLPIDATWKALDVLPAPIWSKVEAETLDVTYTYVGVRNVNGVEQAVIHLEGRVAQAAGGGPDSGGRLSGTAVVDVATGQIVEEEVTTQANVEVMINTVAVKAQSAMVARLRRE